MAKKTPRFFAFLLILALLLCSLASCAEETGPSEAPSPVTAGPEIPSGSPPPSESAAMPEPPLSPGRVEEPSETPDYSDREPFDPPNREDMTLYDTSAILAAWEKKDSSGLSEYDRETYDAGQAVMDEVIIESMSDLEKETAVYNWLVNSVSYDWTHQDIMAETSRDSYGPYGGLVNHSAVCLGYASSFQLLMDMAGVECITVVGAVVHNTGDHAWNLVCLDGNWYGVDSSWEATALEELGEDKWMYEWQYFNMTDQALVENRQWDYASVPKAAEEKYGG